MFAKPLHPNIVVVTNAAQRIVSYEGEVLPQGDWSLTIEAGHAWVFCKERNIPLHKGQSVKLSQEDGNVHIRALYTKGITVYKLARQ